MQWSPLQDAEGVSRNFKWSGKQVFTPWKVVSKHQIRSVCSERRWGERSGPQEVCSWKASHPEKMKGGRAGTTLLHQLWEAAPMEGVCVSNWQVLGQNCPSS